ncbi:MAG: dTDP-glucose 4,6-dehydratase [Candidatus Bathyarchaeia archaeon]
MRILITGGMGFIGSNLIRYLLRTYEDIEILNLDKLSHGSNPANLKDVEPDGRYGFIRGDICDFEAVKAAAKDSDAIINLAAESHVDRSISNPRTFFNSNALGVLNLLEACRIYDLIYQQVSTDEVYGPAPEGRSFAEGDGLDPSSPYAASKASADLLVRAYHKTYGLRATITRSANNFGPYQFPEKLIPKAIIRALLGLPVPIYGSGRQRRDWIYVLDHCEAIDLVLRRGEPGGIYNVSAGNELENLELVETILDLLGRPKSLIEHVKDRPGHDFRYSLDSSKLRALGWRPKHGFREGLRETVEWYVKNEWWWRPLADERVLHPTPWELPW